MKSVSSECTCGPACPETVRGDDPHLPGCPFCVPKPPRDPCGSAVCLCGKFGPAPVELDVSKFDGLERAKRFFFEWPVGARVAADLEIIYLCDDVDGRLPAGSLGTVIRRPMVGLVVVCWDVMPGHKVATSADCLIAAPSESAAT